MKLEGKKVLVVGAGKSGIAASELLLDKKIETVLYDGNKDLDVEKLYEKAPKLKGMPVLLGELTDEQLRAFDVAVLSPGVPTKKRARHNNIISVIDCPEFKGCDCFLTLLNLIEKNQSFPWQNFLFRKAETHSHNHIIYC